MLVNKLWVKLFCSNVGSDQFGNHYYIGKSKDYLGRNKRYVVYNGIDDGSKVPPMWHAWLHYLSNEIPQKIEEKQYKWQREHLPNLSGTNYAYKPAESKCTKVKTYSSWAPK
ncbi:MAG: NADH:ubiquinone oxidoreductase subunit NDUFA12 [Rickettsiaceae bacterium]